MIDEARQEEAALYVLGGLEAAEAERFAADLRNDPELQTVVTELETAAAGLAHAAPLRLPPVALKARVFADIRRENKIVSIASGATWVPWALAASLAICCLLLWRERAQLEQHRAAIIHELQASRARATDQRDLFNRQSAELAGVQKELGDLRQRDSLAEVKIASLTAQVKTYAEAFAVVLWDPAQQRGLVKLDKFPKAGTGKDYQLWVIDPNRKVPVSAGVVQIGEDGGARVAFKPTEKIDVAQAFAISVERTGGAPTPQGQIVALGK